MPSTLTCPPGAAVAERPPGVPLAEEAVAALRTRLEKMARFYARVTGEDAGDLLQEAWLGLLEALRDVDPAVGEARQFLIRRARWRMLDAVKRARSRRMPFLEEQGREPTCCERARPPTASRLERADMRAFAAALHPLQRRILELLLAGLTWREAGARLGCSSANVAYHVRQMRGRYQQWSG